MYLILRLPFVVHCYSRLTFIFRFKRTKSKGPQIKDILLQQELGIGKRYLSIYFTVSFLTFLSLFFFSLYLFIFGLQTLDFIHKKYPDQTKATLGVPGSRVAEPPKVDNSKAQKELGAKYRTKEETLTDTFRQLLAYINKQVEK
jgi:hypothetical protein